MRVAVGLLLLAIAGCCDPSEPETHLIPAGYQGDIIVVFNVRDGEPSRFEGERRLYEVPSTGILETQAEPNYGCGDLPHYFYVGADGRRQSITEFWPSTVPDTAENRVDNEKVGVWFPTNGWLGNAGEPCSVPFMQYFVGTKATLLTRADADQLIDGYARDHFRECEAGS